MAVKVQIIEGDHVFAGEDRVLNFLIVDETVTPAVPLNCSTFELEWRLARNKRDSLPVVVKTTGGGGITVTDGNGTGDKVVVALAAADTQLLLEGEYAFALWKVNLGSAIDLAYGTIWIGRTP